MTNKLDENKDVVREASSSKVIAPSKQERDIIVSIILTDSTTSLLKLNLPHMEDLDSEDSQPAICVVTADCINKAGCSGTSDSARTNKFTNFWFGGGKGARDRDQILPDVAYFRSDPNINESVMSLDMVEELENQKLPVEQDTSRLSVCQKLKPINVYTRPLFAIHSVAHQNQMRSEENNIYISVVNSKLNTTESGWINICRICHGGESIGDLLSPCDCRGSIAMAHVKCLERWLKESENSKCELCQHHFQIIRQPKYSIPYSVLVFLCNPGEHFPELVLDVLALMIYTPAAVFSTYLLMLLCETATHSYTKCSRNVTAHVIAFSSVIGMAAIDFMYSSWLVVNLQKHVTAWRSWYRNTCDVKLILPEGHSTERSKTCPYQELSELD